MIGPRRLILLPGGRRLRAARSVFLAVLAATLGTTIPAAAQGMLRGSLEALPGADNDFSPYALGPAPDTAFGMPDGEQTPPEPYSAAPPPLPEAEPRPRRTFTAEDEPYEQLGIRAGAFLVKPSLTLRGGYDSNPLADNPAKGSSYGRAEARIDVESDWIRHAFRGRLEAGYKAYKEFPEENAPDFATDAALRLDVREDVRVDIALRGSLDTDTRDDPELVGVTSTEQNLRLGARAGLVYKPGRISIAPTIEASRNDYGDPGLSDRDFTQYEASLRTGFELSPALEPFVEGSFNERMYDEDINNNGIAHNSTGYRIYAGARFEPDPIWTAEAKIGYGRQEAEDPAIPAESGLVGEATLIWQPSELTRVRMSGGRDFSATTRACCAVESSWFARGGFDHEFRQWLILRGDVSFEQSDYFNGDRLRDFDAALELEYKFNRVLSALGRVRYENLDSTNDSNDYDATIVEIGLRVQR